jgi:hypothetical protein
MKRICTFLLFGFTAVWHCRMLEISSWIKSTIQAVFLEIKNPELIAVRTSKMAAHSSLTFPANLS